MVAWYRERLAAPTEEGEDEEEQDESQHATASTTSTPNVEQSIAPHSTTAVPPSNDTATAIQSSGTPTLDYSTSTIANAPWDPSAYMDQTQYYQYYYQPQQQQHTAYTQPRTNTTPTPVATVASAITTMATAPTVGM